MTTTDTTVYGPQCAACGDETCTASDAHHKVTTFTPQADRDAVDAADALVNGVPYYGTDLVAGMILDDGTGNQFIVMNLQPAYTLQVAGKVTTFTPDYTRTLVTLRDTQEAHWSAYDRVVTIDNQDQFTVIESPRAYTGE